MRLLLLIIITILMYSSVFAQNPDCKKYRTGKFGYPELPGKISLRKDSVQESYNDGKLEMLWKVRWINDCQYELTCVKLFSDKYPVSVGDRIIATIVSTDENCFTAESVYYKDKNPNGMIIPAAPMCLIKN